MRVLLLNTPYHPTVLGGAERSVQFLAEALVRNGHQTVVVSADAKRGTQVEMFNGVKVYSVGLKNLYWPFGGRDYPKPLKAVWHALDTHNPWMASAFGDILDAEQPEVVHTNTLVGFSAAVWPAIKQRGLPVVHTLRDYYLLCPRSRMFRNGKQCHAPCWDCRLYTPARLRLTRHVDAVVGVSQFVLKQHQRLGYFADTASAHVIYNSYRPDHALVESKRGGCAPVRLGYLGRLDPNKGIELLLRSLSHVPAKAWELRVAGQGRPRYAAALRRRFPLANVQYAGFVDPETFFGDIDVLVVPSQWNEPLGRVILEAYAHGLPVVGSNRGGIPEIIEEGQTGFTFDADNLATLEQRLLQFIENPALAAQMRERVRVKSQEFLPERIMREYELVYQAAKERQAVVRRARSVTNAAPEEHGSVLLKHSAGYFMARGLASALAFVGVALFTRLLSPSEYGHYAVVMAGVGLFNLTIFQGLRAGLIRFLPSYAGEERTGFLSTVAFGFGGMGLLSTALSGAVVWLWPGGRELGGLWLLGVAVLWVHAWFELNQELFRSQLALKYYGRLSVLRAVLVLGLGGLLAWRGWGARGLLVGTLVGTAVPLLGTALRQWRGIRLWPVPTAVLHQLLAYAFPLTVSFALGFVVAGSDRLLLGWLSGVAASGVYAVGYDMAKVAIELLMLVVNLASYPLIVRALDLGGTDQVRGRLTQNATMLLLIALPAATGVVLLAPNIANVVIGAAFREAATQVMPVIAIAAVLSGFKAYHLDLSFQLGRKTLGQVWPMLAAAIVSIGLNLWWIPRWGVHGAAYACLIAYAVGLVLSWRIGQTTFPIPLPAGAIAKVLAATVFMSVVLWPIVHYRGVMALVSQVAMGAVAYGLAVWTLDLMGARAKVAAMWTSACRRMRVT